MKNESSKDPVLLERLLAEASEMMAAKLRSKLLAHPGEVGTAREQVVRDFLSSQLPKRFEVSTGFAFDCTGAISDQLDVIIYEAGICPRFEVPGGKFLFPCEGILAVGQVKSSLTSRQKAKDAFDNLASAKRLDRSAKGTAFDGRFEETLCPTDNYLHQIFTFLFVTGAAMNPDSLGEMLLEEAFRTPVQEMANVIVAMDRYLVTYHCDDGVCPNVMHARGVAIQRAEKPSDAILRFYLLLGRALEVTRTSSLPYWEYLPKHHDMPAKVLASSVETPPPRLGLWTEGR
ncbi:MAG: DUF6602 domain-containing protein [Chthoniobacterales bacterium]